jgi:glycosyltransferase involved in cell wall biosynthesis
MKIAVVGAKGLPPNQGGIEHYCAEIYPLMVKKGHSVDLYARSSYVDLPVLKSFEFQGVQVTSLPCPGWRGADAFIASALGAVIATNRNYDVIHFHALGPSLFTWIPRIASTAKIVVTCHGLDWQRSKWGKSSSRLIHYGEQAAVRFADEIVVVNKELQSYFVDTYNRETIYVPNAPATYANSDPSFAYGESLGLTPKKYLLFLGRLVPEKCPDLLINAFQSLQLEGWKLVFVGGNSDATSFALSLQEMAKDNPNVIFSGELRGSLLAEIVRGAGLFVLPSNVEGMPLSLLEAMQEGIPVLASDILPHRELLRNERGILFKAGDLEHLEERISWAINHPIEMAGMAKRAKEYVLTHHSWEQITQNMLQVFKRVLIHSPNYSHAPLMKDNAPK